MGTQYDKPIWTNSHSEICETTRIVILQHKIHYIQGNLFKELDQIP